MDDRFNDENIMEKEIINNTEEKPVAGEYDSICKKCDGLIARPNVMYGWGGKFCNCKDETNYGRPIQ